MPAEGVPLELGIGAGGQNRMMELLGRERSLTIFLAVWIHQREGQTDRRTTKRTDGRTDTGRQQRPRLRAVIKVRIDQNIVVRGLNLLNQTYHRKCDAKMTTDYRNRRTLCSWSIMLSAN